MLGGKRVLAVIPARGGSKGVPRKNIRVVAGKPLLAYSIDAAKRSRHVDEVVVSSEDAEILDIAAAWGGVPVERPSQLAHDESPGIDPVLHALGACPGYDFVVLLQPTSPLRTAADIDGAIDHCVSLGAPCCVSICEAHTSPYSVFKLEGHDRLRRLMNVAAPARRQDLPVFYVVNGAVYFADASWLLVRRRFLTEETVGFRMPVGRSLDIDTELDLQFFEFMAATVTGGNNLIPR